MFHGSSSSIRLSGSSAILVNTSRSQRFGSLPAEHLVDVHTVKRGNARKNSLNKEIGVSIHKAIGAKVATKSDGKDIKVPVLDSIIQSYTQLSS